MRDKKIKKVRKFFKRQVQKNKYEYIHKICVTSNFDDKILIFTLSDIKELFNILKGE